jgi:integrase/recombinase XerD
LKEFEKFCDGKGILLADKLQIRAYVEACRQKGLTTPTIGQKLAALSNFFQWAIFEDLVQVNPVSQVSGRYLKTYKKNSSSEEHTHKLISVQEAARLVDRAVDIRDKAILMVLLKTGIRRGELTSLEVSDINWQDQSIILKPTAKRTNRMVFFDDETAAYLRRWLAVREHRNREKISALWMTSWGRKISADGIFDMIQATALKVGLHDPASDTMEDHFSAHCARHWFTTHLLRAGMRREYVQWLRGDAIKEAVDTYFHVDPEDVRRAYLACVPQLGI